jgi:hypothetical protein
LTIWTTERATAPLTTLLEIEAIYETNSLTFPKRRYLFLPATYRKALKKTLTSEITLQALAAELKSAKKAKRTLRILHRRYGIYTTKKPKFVKKI